ncbi:MAG: hypothetical protein JSS87_00750 [Acidobacteria bacterium]|nr:hypothetical protein [Acidobacteriota bacterium]
MKRSTRLTHVRQLALGVGLLGVGLLTGCGVALSTPSSATDYNPPPSIHGQVNMGKNNIGFSKITIYQTVNTGTAGPDGRYTGTAKVLGTTTADAGGTWAMPASVKCSSPDMFYVVAAEGVPYLGFDTFTNEPNNTKTMMMTAVGDCSILNQSNVSIFTNEATTVAAVNALAPFISVSGQTVNVVSSATNYAGVNGVGTAASAAGLKHAFANANNLDAYDTGVYNTATGGNAIYEGGTINMPLLGTLAYMQYLGDVGSDAGGGDYTYRDQLLKLTTPPGGSEPATTLEAMLNIAQRKYNIANVVPLWQLTQTQMPHPTTTCQANNSVGHYATYNCAPYFPQLLSSSNLSDFSVAITYPKGYGQTSTGQGLAYPLYVALDANDNVYVANASASSSAKGNVIAIESSTGNILWTSNDDTGSFKDPRAIAVDSQNHVFAVSKSVGTGSPVAITEWNASTGTTMQTIPTTGLTNLAGIAVDAHNNLWVTSGTAGFAEYTNAGSNTYTAGTPVTTVALGQVQIDQNQNVWAASATTANQMYFLPNTGTAAAPAYASPVKSTPIAGTGHFGVGIDATGAAISMTAGTGTGVYKTTVTGTGASATLSASVVATTAVASPKQGQTDGIGSYWAVDNASGKPIFRYVPGVAAAVAYLPCYAEQGGTYAGAPSGSNTSISCTATGLSSKLDLAIDSTGSVWTTGAATGVVTQILGVAAPTWPLKSQAKHGVMP